MLRFPIIIPYFFSVSIVLGTFNHAIQFNYLKNLVLSSCPHEVLSSMKAGVFFACFLLSAYKNPWSPSDTINTNERIVIAADIRSPPFTLQTF